VRDEEQGLAASLFQTAFQVGGAIGAGRRDRRSSIAGGANDAASPQATLHAYRPALGLIRVSRRSVCWWRWLGRVALDRPPTGTTRRVGSIRRRTQTPVDSGRIAPKRLRKEAARPEQAASFSGLRYLPMSFLPECVYLSDDRRTPC